MAHFLIAKNKINALSNGTLLIGLGILLFTGWWWPGILLVVWATLGVRQYLSGRRFDFMLMTVILLGLFLVSFFNWNWDVMMPVLLVIGGIYLIFREYFFAEDTNGEEKSIEIEEDMEE